MFRFGTKSKSRRNSAVSAPKSDSPPSPLPALPTNLRSLSTTDLVVPSGSPAPTALQAEPARPKRRARLTLWRRGASTSDAIPSAPTPSPILPLSPKTARPALSLPASPASSISPVRSPRLPTLDLGSAFAEVDVVPVGGNRSLGEPISFTPAPPEQAKINSDVDSKDPEAYFESLSTVFGIDTQPLHQHASNNRMDENVAVTLESKGNSTTAWPSTPLQPTRQENAQVTPPAMAPSSLLLKTAHQDVNASPTQPDDTDISDTVSIASSIASAGSFLEGASALFAGATRLFSSSSEQAPKPDAKAKPNKDAAPPSFQEAKPKSPTKAEQRPWLEGKTKPKASSPWPWRRQAVAEFEHPRFQSLSSLYARFASKEKKQLPSDLNGIIVSLPRLEPSQASQFHLHELLSRIDLLFRWWSAALDTTSMDASLSNVLNSLLGRGEWMAVRVQLDIEPDPANQADLIRCWTRFTDYTTQTLALASSYESTAAAVFGTTNLCARAAATAYAFVPGAALSLGAVWSECGNNNELKAVAAIDSVEPQSESKSDYPELPMTSARLRPLHQLRSRTRRSIESNPFRQISRRWTGAVSDLLYKFSVELHDLIQFVCVASGSKTAILSIPGMGLVCAALVRAFWVSDSGPGSGFNPTGLGSPARVNAGFMSAVQSALSPTAAPGLRNMYTAVLQALTSSVEPDDSSRPHLICSLIEETSSHLGRTDPERCQGPGSSEMPVHLSWLIPVFNRLLRSSRVAVVIGTLTTLFHSWLDLAASPISHVRLAFEVTLADDAFEELYLHWSVEVRSHFLRLLVWRVCVVPDMAAEPSSAGNTGSTLLLGAPPEYLNALLCRLYDRFNKLPVELTTGEATIPAMPSTRYRLTLRRPDGTPIGEAPQHIPLVHRIPPSKPRGTGAGTQQARRQIFGRRDGPAESDSLTALFDDPHPSSLFAPADLDLIAPAGLPVSDFFADAYSAFANMPFHWSIDRRGPMPGPVALPLPARLPLSVSAHELAPPLPSPTTAFLRKHNMFCDPRQPSLSAASRNRTRARARARPAPSLSSDRSRSRSRGRQTGRARGPSSNSHSLTASSGSGSSFSEAAESPTPATSVAASVSISGGAGLSCPDSGPPSPALSAADTAVGCPDEPAAGSGSGSGKTPAPAHSANFAAAAAVPRRPAASDKILGKALAEWRAAVAEWEAFWVDVSRGGGRAAHASPAVENNLTGRSRVAPVFLRRQF